MKKLSNEEFKEKAFNKTSWLLEIKGEYSSKKEKILVKCKNGHELEVPCKELTRDNRLKKCPICRQEEKNNKKYCLVCGKELEKKQEKFCSHNCSAIYNNKKRKKSKKCLHCGKEIFKKNKFCSNKCQKDFEYQKRIKKWKEHPELEKRECKIPYIKRYLEEKYGHKCQLCGWHKVHPVTGKVPLEVHHINGVASDNREENLQLLCPNCHSLTPTYRGLNQGSGRKKRY